MAKPKITVLVDGDRVTLRGNTADVHVTVQVTGQRSTVTDNELVKAWYERPLGMAALAIFVTVVGGGVIYYLGWT